MSESNIIVYFHTVEMIASGILIVMIETTVMSGTTVMNETISMRRITAHSTIAHRISDVSSQNRYSIGYLVCRVTMMPNRKSIRASFVNCRLKKKLSRHRAAIQRLVRDIVACLARCWAHCKNSAKKSHGSNKKKRKKRKSKRNWRNNKCKNAKI